MYQVHVFPASYLILCNSSNTVLLRYHKRGAAQRARGKLGRLGPGNKVWSTDVTQCGEFLDVEALKSEVTGTPVVPKREHSACNGWLRRQELPSFASCLFSSMTLQGSSCCPGQRQSWSFLVHPIKLLVYCVCFLSVHVKHSIPYYTPLFLVGLLLSLREVFYAGSTLAVLLSFESSPLCG